jgi:hypothetical protein
MKTLLVMALLLAGCGREQLRQLPDQDPETLKGTEISMATGSYITRNDTATLTIYWESQDGMSWFRKYEDDQAIRVLRQWLDANYPEEP